jgi:hypothetical protein
LRSQPQCQNESDHHRQHSRARLRHGRGRGRHGSRAEVLLPDEKILAVAVPVPVGVAEAVSPVVALPLAEIVVVDVGILVEVAGRVRIAMPPGEAILLMKPGSVS